MRAEEDAKQRPNFEMKLNRDFFPLDLSLAVGIYPLMMTSRVCDPCAVLDYHPKLKKIKRRKRRDSRKC